MSGAPAVALPGFADPVAGAQRCFRAVLDATARPGRIRRTGEELVAPAPLCPAAAAVLLTLVDGETPLWIDPAAMAAHEWIAFHCGAAPVPEPGAASFALAFALPDLASLHAGSHHAPELSATVILQVAALGRGRRYRLCGPGLQAPTELAVEGLPDGFASVWSENHALYPRGIDLLLCAGEFLAALPRSAAVESL